MEYLGSLSIAPTGNCTHFLKLVVARGGFYSYYIHQGNKSDKERKIARKKLSFMHTKRFHTLFKRWVQFKYSNVQFRVGAIPRLPNNYYDDSVINWGPADLPTKKI